LVAMVPQPVERGSRYHVPTELRLVATGLGEFFRNNR
jgi:hypothetical protein